MKKTYFWLLSFLIGACQQKENDAIHSDAITYSMDTVSIDAKGEILDVDRNLNNSGITADQQFLYNFNHFDNHLEKVNLNKLELVSKTPFQKEGPEGTGNSMSSFQFMKDGQLLISNGFFKQKIFDLNGKVLQTINLTAHDWNGEVLQDVEVCRQNLLIDKTKLLSLVTEEGLNVNHKAELALFDLNTKMVSRFDIDPQKKIKSYALSSEDYTYMPPIIYFSILNNTPVLSHQFTNEIYRFDSAANQILEVDYESHLTPNEVSTDLPHKFATTEELFEVFEKMNEQIRFGPLVYDQENDRYYRFSFQTEFKTTSERESSFPEIKSIDAYLSIFDDEFNMISEALIPEINRTISHYFAKDGTLWILDNKDDEMVFVRLNFL
ncbi:hypothetical protein DN752_15495 [Echinicola strongylocentroti]|uniref:DUF4221 domain-containing protein n=1 Tax=Echinicola strongylocentroti TaxID=1795355 RepID=A0A2Z4ILZ8_9BACT|nr:DUF4221 family protein [Echinicola strongylocentroti]AWW31413.1 hypothetical protein DN752_15495 [Echinicola strongylocentroti]